MDLQLIEERALNNWPALTTVVYEGWLVRFANGYSKRANSVSALYGEKKGVDQKIIRCEQLYASQSLPTIFKLTPFTKPVDLDKRLKVRGYKVVDRTSIQTLKLCQLVKPSFHHVTIEDQVTMDWLNDYCQLSHKNQTEKATMSKMLMFIVQPVGFVRLYEKNNVVACGFGVIDRGFVGIYDVIVHSDFQRKGFGKELMLHLLNWGKVHGATYSYLAVVGTNDRAKNLYAALGFTEAYQCWYRVKKNK